MPMECSDTEQRAFSYSCCDARPDHRCWCKMSAKVTECCNLFDDLRQVISLLCFISKMALIISNAFVIYGLKTLCTIQLYIIVVVVIITIIAIIIIISAV